MQEKVYRGWASQAQKNRYICKSEVTREELRKMGIPEFITIQEAKKAFDIVLLTGNYLIMWTGSSIDKNKQRRTWYVPKYALYREIIKGH